MSNVSLLTSLMFKSHSSTGASSIVSIFYICSVNFLSYFDFSFSLDPALISFGDCYCFLFESAEGTSSKLSTDFLRCFLNFP